MKTDNEFEKKKLSKFITFDCMQTSNDMIL